MIKKVRNSERPIMTMFGGTCCPPKACLRKESTTTILVNEVSIISTAGRKDRKLINRNTSITGLLMSLKSIASAGDDKSSRTTNNTEAVNRDLIKYFFLYSMVFNFL